VAKIAPGLAVCLVDLDDGTKKLKSLVVEFATLEYHADGAHSGGRVGVSLQSALVGLRGLFGSLEKVGEAT
jgi:hypothetical protein